MLLERIGRLADEAPDRVAVVAGGECASYRSLRQRTDTLAARLRDRGVGPGHLVAVYLPRSVDLLVAMLGVMRSGAAYTVVEEDGNPEEHRLRLLDIAADLVIADGDGDGDGDGAERLAEAGFAVVSLGAPLRALESAPSAPPPPLPVAEETAYVLFTSGSTGRPKGVRITHANIAHYTTALMERLGMADAAAEPLRYAHVSTLSADLGNTCLFLSLWSGGTLHLLGSALRRDPAGMLDYLVRHRIDVLKITPSHWKAMFRLAGSTRPALRYLVLGGELLTVPFAAEIWQSGVTDILVNHYGPTETTVGVTATVIRSERELEALTGGSVPIGAPFGRTRLLVRTDEGAFRDRDADGELYIGGPSVGPGYFRNPEATAASFLSGIEGDLRFYKTGDFVRIDANGVVEFRGRTDRQVKVNGYRVELEHVETLLATVPGVREAAVWLLTVNGRGQLVAAVQPAVAEPERLRRGLAAVMPAHMIPAHLFGFDSFPLNANGKTDRAALKPLVEAALAAVPDGDGWTANAGDDPLEEELRGIWRKYLGHGRFGRTDSFHDVGGDSIGAIQVISDLQILGYTVSAATFLANPTIASLAEAMRAGGQDAESDGHPVRQGGSRFSAAQRDLLSAGLADPDHWNQAILLTSAKPVRPGTLERALDRLVALHPLLRTAYRSPGHPEDVWPEDAWVAETLDAAPGPVLTSSVLECGSAGPAIAARAQELHRAIDLRTGAVFRVHLFRTGGEGDHVLFVCHHLSIDAVSWRIVLDDLDRLYGALEQGVEPAFAPARRSFWDWVDHMEDSIPRLRPDLAHWQAAPDAAGRAGDGAGDGADNLEGTARTVWLAFSRAQTRRLADSPAGARLHAALLAAFAQAYVRDREATDGGDGPGRLTVDVESHGRLAFDDRFDPSHLVGWFTSTFPLRLAVDPDDPLATVHAVEGALAGVPHLGVAHGLAGPAGPRPRICYNYLGDFRFPGGALGFTAARHAVGPARGAANDRLYDLKLTARTVDGHLVVDLSFSPGRHGEERMVALMRETRRRLLALAEAGSEPDSADGQMLVEAGSSSGLLTYVPSALSLDPPVPAAREYREILLTGATGFIGCHVLRELLLRTRARIHCLVRVRDGEPPAERLARIYESYFPDESFAALGERCLVLAGDVGEPLLGLAPETFDWLNGHCDALYHFAADTRLFGDAARFEAQNIRPVETLLALAASGRPKHVHYMSTLAVAGINRAVEPVPFGEDSLDIGQSFQNEYERTKERAERLVQAFRMKGGTAFIYRSGNVSGHSRTGMFQLNAGDNRFVQFLAAVTRLGALPRDIGDRIVLSPVDRVAAGIAALSLDPALTGGTFHVDSDREVAYADLFAALRRLDFPLRPSDAPDFATLFERAADTRDPVVAVALFWARRPSRNVRFDNRRTLERLDRAGIRFDPLGPDWLARFLGRLAAAGVLLPPPAAGRARLRETAGLTA